MTGQIDSRDGSWALVIHDPKKIVVIRSVLSLDISEGARICLPGVVRRGTFAELAPLLERLLHFKVWAELRLSADFPEFDPARPLNVPISDRDFTTLARLTLGWRFTDANYNVLPEGDLNQIKPLAPAKAALAWNALLTLIDGPGQSLDHAKFEALEITHAGDAEEVRGWLRERIGRHSGQLVVSWQPAEAVVTTPTVFCRYWDDFCYAGADDVIVWPCDDSLAMLYHHDRILCFGRRNKEPA